MGSTNRAQKEATQAEAQRKASVEEAQRRIEAIYSAPGRENDIRDVQNATRDYLQGDLDRQNKSAGRELKFALARSGNTMGSVDTDKNRALSEDYLRGAVEVARRSDAAGNSLRQADQSSKLGLFSMAQQGLDMTTAARQAGESMRVNIGQAKADALQTGLGDLFKNFGDMYKTSKENAGKRQAERYQYGTFYSPNQNYSSGGGGSWG